MIRRGMNDEANILERTYALHENEQLDKSEYIALINKLKIKKLERILDGNQG